MFEVGEGRLDMWDEGVAVEEVEEDAGEKELERNREVALRPLFRWQALCKTPRSPLALSLACSCPRRSS